MMPALFLVAGRTGWFAVVADVDRVINAKAAEPAEQFERLHIRGPMARTLAFAEGSALVRALSVGLPSRNLNKSVSRSRRREAATKEAAR